MNEYVTYNGLALVIAGIFAVDVLAHIGTDLAKLAWSRRKARKTQTH